MLHTKNYPYVLFAVFLLAGCADQKQPEQSRRIVPLHSAGSPANESMVNSFNTAQLAEAYLAGITQTFTVKHKAVSSITGKKGLKVMINPAHLETIDGQPVDGDITVKIVELTSSEDLFKSNAATMSNGKLLASGGSYYVGMESKGKSIRLKEKRSVQMEFPRLKEQGMELFYGNRDKEGNINWLKANEPLTFSYAEAKITKYRPPFPDNIERKRFWSKFELYHSLKDKVYYNNRLMTIEQFAHYLQGKGVDKYIDTLFISSADLYNHRVYYSTHHHDTLKVYRLVSCKDIEDDNAYRERERKITEERDEANRQYDKEWREANTLEGKLQSYYAPSAVTNLGWINCDRFYEVPVTPETPVEIPYTFTDPSIDYFIIYKSINGLMSGKLAKNKQEQFVLRDLPAGEAVTLVAFTKQNGIVYSCKENFTTAANKIIKPSFKPISAEEVKKMFGSSIRI